MCSERKAKIGRLKHKMLLVWLIGWIYFIVNSPSKPMYPFEDVIWYICDGGKVTNALFQIIRFTLIYSLPFLFILILLVNWGSLYSKFVEFQPLRSLIMQLISKCKKITSNKHSSKI